MATPTRPTQPAAPGPGTLSRRDERRLANAAEIKAIARRQLAEHGPSGVSLREISREMRMASAAVYRYFTGRDELITALCVDAYESLADALTTAVDEHPADEHASRWWAIGTAYRRWSLDNRPDFTLIFGTPVVGHHAPESATSPAAGRSLAVPLQAYAAAVAAHAADPDQTQIPNTITSGDLLHHLLQTHTPGHPPRLAAITLTAWASLLGFLTTEVFGSLTQLIPDTDQLYEAHLRTVMTGMGYQPLP